MHDNTNRNIDNEIAALLHASRKAKHLTQKQAAEKAGMDIRHYQHFEGEERSLVTSSFSTTMAVLEALDINPKAFIEQYVKPYKK